MYVLFSERFEGNKPVRYLYSYYSDDHRNIANETALELKERYQDPDLFFCVIHVDSLDELKEWDIR